MDSVYRQRLTQPVILSEVASATERRIPAFVRTTEMRGFFRFTLLSIRMTGFQNTCQNRVIAPRYFGKLPFSVHSLSVVSVRSVVKVFTTERTEITEQQRGTWLPSESPNNLGLQRKRQAGKLWD